MIGIDSSEDMLNVANANRKSNDVNCRVGDPKNRAAG